MEGYVSYPGRSARRPRGLSEEKSKPIAVQKSAEGEVGGQSGKASEAPHGESRGKQIGRAVKPPPKARTDTGEVDAGRWNEKVVLRLATTPTGVVISEPYDRRAKLHRPWPGNGNALVRDPYARCCGRGAPARVPPIPIGCDNRKEPMKYSDQMGLMVAMAVMFLTVGCSGFLQTERAPPTTNAYQPFVVPAYHPGNFEHIETVGIVKAFTAVMQQDFDVVHHSVVEFPNPPRWFGNPWWLVEVRPRRPGQFVVRHEYHTMRGNADEPKPEPMTREYFLTIGERGQPRYFHWSIPGGTQTDPTPTACMGDTLILFFPIHEGMTDHRFSNESTRQWIFKSRNDAVEDIKELVVATTHRRDAETINLAQEYFNLLHVTADSSGAVRPGVYVHRIRGVLRATNEGCMDILSTSENQVPGREFRRPVIIASTNETLRIPVFRAESSAYYARDLRDEGRSFGRTPNLLRVGDYLCPRLFMYSTTHETEAPSQFQHPKIVISVLPFNGKWPFEVAPAGQK